MQSINHFISLEDLDQESHSELILFHPTQLAPTWQNQQLNNQQLQFQQQQHQVNQQETIVQQQFIQQAHGQQQQQFSLPNVDQSNLSNNCPMQQSFYPDNMQFHEPHSKGTIQEHPRQQAKEEQPTLRMYSYSHDFGLEHSTSTRSNSFHSQNQLNSEQSIRSANKSQSIASFSEIKTKLESKSPQNQSQFSQNSIFSFSEQQQSASPQCPLSSSYSSSLSAPILPFPQVQANYHKETTAYFLEHFPSAPSSSNQVYLGEHGINIDQFFHQPYHVPINNNIHPTQQEYSYIVNLTQSQQTNQAIHRSSLDKLNLDKEIKDNTHQSFSHESYVPCQIPTQQYYGNNNNQVPLLTASYFSHCSASNQGYIAPVFNNVVMSEQQQPYHDDCQLKNTTDMFISGVIYDKLIHHPMPYELPNASTSQINCSLNSELSQSQHGVSLGSSCYFVEKPIAPMSKNNNIQDLKSQDQQLLSNTIAGNQLTGMTQQTNESLAVNQRLLTDTSSKRDSKCSYSGTHSNLNQEIIQEDSEDESADSSESYQSDSSSPPEPIQLSGSTKNIKKAVSMPATPLKTQISPTILPRKHSQLNTHSISEQEEIICQQFSKVELNKRQSIEIKSSEDPNNNSNEQYDDILMLTQNKKNVVKNIMSALKTYILTWGQKTSIERIYNAPTASSEDIDDIRRKFKRYIETKSFNHYSLRLLILHPNYGAIFKYFLTSYSEEWLQNSKIKDTESHHKMIQFCLSCFDDIKIIDTLRRHPKKKCRFS